MGQPETGIVKDLSLSDLADIGVLGLGVMGANLALNLAEKGFRAAIYDTDEVRRAALAAGAFSNSFIDCATPEVLLASIRPPRPVILLVPAGAATEEVIEMLSARADAGDMLIDAGNSDFHDTRRRTAQIEARGQCFLGVGVSGGAEGARNGPALMAGGTSEIWERVAPMFTAIAARYGDDPCAAHLGPDGAGHFVKTVHNGIEYADMQMIAETYGLMRDGLLMAPEQIADTFGSWSSGPLSSYLVEITAKVLAARDTETDAPLVEKIADRAGQKGTGRWSVIEAQRLGAAASTIEAAVAARNLSGAQDLRAQLASAPKPDVAKAGNVRGLAAGDLHDALHAGKIIAYAQGFDMLEQASRSYEWSLDRAQIARVWRAGCIIRSSMLDEIAKTFDVDSGHLLAAPGVKDRLLELVPALRRTVAAATLDGIAAPALGAALAYIDQLSNPQGTANLLQGLRDFFGHHGFERTDRPGTGFHGPWVDH